MAPTLEQRFPFHDPTLPVQQRVDDLMSRMELADKVGMLFHTMVAFGDPTVPNTTFSLPSAESMIVKRRMTHFNVVGGAQTGREFAQWHNLTQRIALKNGLGIPISFSTDPRHAFRDNPLTSMMAGAFSQWPEPLGMAAIASAQRVEEFANIARQEYLAVGLRIALHPQIDLATEPRWSRINGTFGEDADLTSRLAVAYIKGFHGGALGEGSVATMTKHFPGGGPQKDGEDPHFAWAREQVYPGHNQEYHLKPFIAALDAGATQIMPYYGMPVGTEWEEVGFGFNKDVITGLLRERLGFDGIVCTDWGLLTDATIFGAEMPARAWGVESLSRSERMLTALDAGVDQFGGELCTEVLLELVDSGRVTQDRLDVSVRRLLHEKFVLGLFDNPFVDEERADIIVARDDFIAEGLAAQSDSVTLLTNHEGILPLKRGCSVYVEGIDAEEIAAYATVVSTPDEADVAIVRLKAPFEIRDRGGFSAMFHTGSLEFPPQEHERLTRLAKSLPTIIDIYLDRPVVLGGLEDIARALLASYGTSDRALLTVLFGERSPLGALPFDLPRSDKAVENSRSDVPFDTENPTFRFGHGLQYADA